MKRPSFLSHWSHQVNGKCKTKPWCDSERKVVSQSTSRIVNRTWSTTTRATATSTICAASVTDVFTATPNASTTATTAATTTVSTTTITTSDLGVRGRNYARFSRLRCSSGYRSIITSNWNLTLMVWQLVVRWNCCCQEVLSPLCSQFTGMTNRGVRHTRSTSYYP